MKTSNTTLSAQSEIVPLFEFTKVVNSSLDLSFILGTLLLTIMGKLLVGKALVLIRKDNADYVVQYGKGIAKDLIGYRMNLRRTGRKYFRVPDRDQYVPLFKGGIVFLFPIFSHDVIIGYIGVGGNPSASLTKEKIQFIETLINISAAAIEKGIAFDEIKDINRQLDGRVQQLKTLFELGKEFSGILERDQLIKVFSLTLMGQVGTNRFAICLQEGESIYSRMPSLHLEEAKDLICSLVTSPMLTAEIPSDKKYAVLKDRLNAEKIVALVPLQIHNEVKGVLCLGNRLRGGTYSHNDLEYIFSLSNLAFVSLENARLFNDAIEKQRLENELLIAREIQQQLLPRELPSITNMEIVASNISSKQVGGDYYDVIPTQNGKYVIAIGDVSGKGTPASLLMANVQATVHALVPFELPLPEATARINDLIHRNTGTDKFITFFWGILDPDTRIFRYVNAGHNPPFVLRKNGSIERLTEGGLILGVMKTLVPYSEGNVLLEAGDAIIMYTDGVSEAMDVNGNDYTEERLEEYVLTMKNRNAKHIHDAVIDEIQSYCSGAPQSDDITLVVLKAR